MYFNTFPVIPYDSVGDYNFKEVTNILLKKGTSISKVLNTQAFSIRDLKRSFVVDKNININQLN